MRTVLRWSLYGLVTVVVLVASLYLATALRGRAHLAEATRQASADVAAARPARQLQADRDRGRIRSGAVTRWGRPSYSWQELVCTQDSTEAGWLVESTDRSARSAAPTCSPCREPGAGRVSPSRSRPGAGLPSR